MSTPFRSETGNDPSAAGQPVAQGVAVSPAGQSVSRAVPAGPRVWLLVLAVAAGAALVSWGVEERDLRVSDPVLQFKREKGASFAAVGKVLRVQILDATTRTAMLSYGALGGLLGLGLGLAGGRLHGSTARGLAAGAAGLIVGASAGALLSSWLVPRYYNAVAVSREAVEDNLSFPFLTHLGLWIGVGLAAGLALGLAGSSWKQGALAVLGGLVGAAVGTALFEFIGAVAFPLAETNLPISKELGSRLLAHVAVATAAAVGAWGASHSVQLGRDPASFEATGRDAGRSVPA